MLLDSKRNFLKADEVKTGDTLKILNEGEWVTSKKFKYDNGEFKQQFIIKVEFDGIEKDMTLNKTNQKTLIEAWGRETALWKDQRATIEVVKMMVGTELKNVIILTA